MKNDKKIKFEVLGIPPHKDTHFSIRNRRHPNHERFLELRRVANLVMDEKPYWEGPISIKFHYVRKDGKLRLIDYIQGICDALDGSHGFTFHWAPVVFLDDCQVRKIDSSQEIGNEDKYYLEIDFLDSQ